MLYGCFFNRKSEDNINVEISYAVLNIWQFNSHKSHIIMIKHICQAQNNGKFWLFFTVTGGRSLKHTFWVLVIRVISTFLLSHICLLMMCIFSSFICKLHERDWTMGSWITAVLINLVYRYKNLLFYTSIHWLAYNFNINALETFVKPDMRCSIT